VVVGQTLRHMGYVNQELAVKGKSVRGIVIALKDVPSHVHGKVWLDAGWETSS
jgi:hypothetical protein